MQLSLVCSTSPRHEPRQALRVRLPQIRRLVAVRNPCISPPPFRCATSSTQSTTAFRLSEDKGSGGAELEGGCFEMGLLLLQRGKRGRSLEAMGEQDRSGGRIGHIHTTHKGLSCSKDSGVDQTRGGRVDDCPPAPFIFCSLSLNSPRHRNRPRYHCCCHCLTLFLPSVPHAALSSFFIPPCSLCSFLFLLCVCVCVSHSVLGVEK